MNDNNLTESGSITGKTILSLTQIRRLGLPHGGNSLSTFRDIVSLEARSQAAERCVYELGLTKTGSYKTEQVIISSVQFSDDGDIVVYWIARFSHTPTNQKENSK